MATIKVFDVFGVKEIKCFDTLDNVPYIEEEEIDGAPDDTDAPE